MEKKTLGLLAGVGAVAAAAGLGAGSLIWGGGPATEQTKDEHDEGEHTEGEEHAEGAAEGEEGFVALPPETASAAGVEITTVARGGGAELLIPGRAAFSPNAEASVGAPLPGVAETVVTVPAMGDRMVVRPPEPGEPTAATCACAARRLASALRVAARDASRSCRAVTRSWKSRVSRL
jgi:membrane fusion protein, heavy metal efflux system